MTAGRWAFWQAATPKSTLGRGEMYELAFVDTISETPVVRLDLRAHPFNVRLGTNFGAPELRRAVSGGTLLADGEAYPADAYGNRIVTLVVQIDADGDAAALAYQSLMREITRPTNVLRFQPETSAPVHFRTFRAPPHAVHWEAVNKQLTVSLPASPFALGLRETVGPFSIAGNPTVGDGRCFDITGVRGDVKAPAVIEYPATVLVTTGSSLSLIAVRQFDSVPEFALWVQAESHMSGPDTSAPGNDANMSGTGSNYAHVSFATTPAMTERVRFANTIPGRFRVLARVRRSDSTSDIRMQATYGDSTPFLSPDGAVTLPLTASIITVDLGMVETPTGAASIYDGDSGSRMPVFGFVGAAAELVSGTGTVDIDYIALVGADGELAYIRYPAFLAGTADRVRLDSVQHSHVLVSVNDDVLSATGPIQLAGAGAFHLVPNAVNRLWYVRHMSSSQAANTDSLFVSTDITVHYWPRYIFVAAPGL